MNQGTFDDAVKAAKDFLAAAAEVKGKQALKINVGEAAASVFWSGSRETAALKRRSMDLTNALVDLRKAN